MVKIISLFLLVTIFVTAPILAAPILKPDQALEARASVVARLGKKFQSSLPVGGPDLRNIPSTSTNYQECTRDQLLDEWDKIRKSQKYIISALKWIDGGDTKAEIRKSMDGKVKRWLDKQLQYLGGEDKLRIALNDFVQKTRKRDSAIESELRNRDGKD